jgi:hypothetical protein
MSLAFAAEQIHTMTAIEQNVLGNIAFLPVVFRACQAANASHPNERTNFQLIHGPLITERVTVSGIRSAAVRPE